MGNQAGRKEGKSGSESRRMHRGIHCEEEAGRRERQKQRLSSQNPKLKRTKESENSGGQKVNGVNWKGSGRKKAEWKGNEVEPREARKETRRQG